jgi:hypothetical protein
VAWFADLMDVVEHTGDPPSPTMRSPSILVVGQLAGGTELCCTLTRLRRPRVRAVHRRDLETSEAHPNQPTAVDAEPSPHHFGRLASSVEPRWCCLENDGLKRLRRPVGRRAEYGPVERVADRGQLDRIAHVVGKSGVSLCLAECPSV